MPTEMPTEPTNFWCRDDRRSRTEWPLRRVHFCEICRWGVWGGKEISLLGSSDSGADLVATHDSKAGEW
eukprot:scaffold20769_cov33-Cyclotella_meneghiniana.AAC.1